MKRNILLPLSAALLIYLFIVSPACAAENSIPQTVRQLWNSFPQLDQNTPLEIKVIREWQVDNIHLQLLRFTVAEIRKNKTRIAGYYAYPAGAKNVPGLLQINGGPQRAFSRGPLNWAQKGYAVFNPHLSETSISDEEDDTPASDWGNLMPQKNEPRSADKGINPRKSDWYARTVAARRCLTLLQSRPQVDPDRLAVRGHSTGGVLTVYTMIDPRVKAAVPSVGGPGYWYVPRKYLIGTTRRGVSEQDLDLYLRTLSGEAYWKRVQCPVLFLGASNDFNSPLDNIARSMQLVPHEKKRLIIAPHLNHRFTPEAENSVDLWFEMALRQEFIFPQTARTELSLDTPDGIPVLKVWPDTSSPHKIAEVNVYYAYDREPQARFWADGRARKVDNHWEGKCPIFYDDEPLFAFANIIYDRHDKTKQSGRFLVTSEYQTVYPEDLQQVEVKPTEKPQRLIDDFSRGHKDWIANLDNAHNWSLETRKLIDPRWVGPEGASLVTDIKTTESEEWLGISVSRRFFGKNSRRFLFYHYEKLPSAGWNTISLQPEDFVNAYGEKLDGWQKILTLNFSPASNLVNDHKKSLTRAKDLAVPATLPDTTSQWKGQIPEFRNIRWEGGEYITQTKPWQEMTTNNQN